MATTLNAGTTTATALNVITDTTGAMAIQTSGTTAIAISSSQVVSLTNPLLPASGGTGISSLGTGVATFLGTPSSANLAAAVTDETGTGALVFAASPTLSGTPLAPTASPGTNTTQVATTAFVGAAITAQGLGTIATQNANNVAVTGGSITGITDLAVADGGTGASTFTANSVVLGNGTSSLSGNMVAPSTAGKVLASNGTTWVSTTIASSGAKLGLGITGETWNTGGYSANTQYTNSFGYPIQVSAWQNSQYNSNAYMYVNGTLIGQWGAQFNGAGAISGIGGFIVPTGATWQINTNSGGTSGYAVLY